MTISAINPLAEGAEILQCSNAVQQPIYRTRGVVSFEPSTEGLRAPQFR